VVGRLRRTLTMLSTNAGSLEGSSKVEWSGGISAVSRMPNSGKDSPRRFSATNSWCVQDSPLLGDCDSEPRLWWQGDFPLGPNDRVAEPSPQGLIAQRLRHCAPPRTATTSRPAISFAQPPIIAFMLAPADHQSMPGPPDAPHSFHSFSQFQIPYATSFWNGNPS